MDTFASKLINSGFDNETAQRLLINSAACFSDIKRRSELSREDKDYRPLHPSQKYLKNERILSKAVNKSSWYINKSRRKGRWRASIPQQWKPKRIRQRNIEGIETTSVMIVPNTYDSELVNSLIKKEAQISRLTGYSLKLVEGNGTPLARILPAPTANTKCNKRSKCAVCVTDSKKARNAP